jgi:hypothetical protein
MRYASPELSCRTICAFNSCSIGEAVTGTYLTPALKPSRAAAIRRLIEKGLEAGRRKS